ncbi:MAG: hypothetical protein DYH02_10550 [Candidatus Omnitrophica bacterium COP1]|nr:hypothetical protein [Candidatus Omnitrophica bacterium COP1]
MHTIENSPARGFSAARDESSRPSDDFSSVAIGGMTEKPVCDKMNNQKLLNDRRLLRDSM